MTFINMVNIFLMLSEQLLSLDCLNHVQTEHVYSINYTLFSVISLFEPKFLRE